MQPITGLRLAWLAASLSLAACARAPSPTARLAAVSPAATAVVTATTAPRVTATASTGDVGATPSTADVGALLADPPAAMQSVEIDAYHGDGYESLPGRGRYESMSGCPTANSSPLTDHGLWLTLSFAGAVTSNPVPDGAAWLIAAVPGEGGFPELPRFGRLRGHLGDPEFAHCPHAERIFTVEQVVATYEQKQPFAYPKADFTPWSQYRDPRGRFSLAYPSDWDLTAVNDDHLELRFAALPANPVTVSVVRGTGRPSPPADTTAAGTAEIHTPPGGFHQRPPEPFATADVPSLVGDVRYCAGDLTDGCVEVVFTVAGTDYVLRHEYPTGFDARQDSLWTFEAIANAFQIEGRATVTPTPAPNAVIGPGPFWTREQAEAMALEMIPYGPWTVTDTRLVSEAEAVRLDLCETHRDDPDYQWYTWPAAVWIVELTGVFDGRDAVFYTYLDAANGRHICTAEKGTRPGPP